MGDDKSATLPHQLISLDSVAPNVCGGSDSMRALSMFHLLLITFLRRAFIVLIVE